MASKDDNTQAAKNGGIPEGDEEYTPMGHVVCNFQKASRKWGRALMRLQREAAEAQSDISTARVVKISKLKPDVSNQEQYAFMQRQAEADASIAAALAVVDDGEDRANALFAVVVTKIGSEHLVEGAPDKLDWNNPESFEWLLETSYGRLLEEVAQQRQEAVKKTRR